MKCMILLGTILLAAVTTTEAVICKTDNDCGSGECCYIEPEFLIASKKRQLSLAPPSNRHDIGVCEKMKAAGDPCDVFAIINGQCGCPSGYSCSWVPDPTTPKPLLGTQGRRRGMIPHNEPGSYKCA